MKTAIILHGAPSKEEYYDPNCPSASNHHWIPWLQKQLLIRDIAAYTPEIPYCFDPQYDIWLREFERYEIKEDTILVGHSCGGGFITRWLSENKNRKVGRVVLVAPWLDPARRRTTDFFNFEIDPGLAERTDGFGIFNSSNDEDLTQSSAFLIRDTVKHCYFREFENAGHFCLENMGTDEFPELLDLLVVED
jgi:predicted alpha/beta hydrolase family esterase